jgi:hypothetical protein
MPDRHRFYGCNGKDGPESQNVRPFLPATRSCREIFSEVAHF